MRKITLALVLTIILSMWPNQVDAKVWTQELVDKVTLNSGYKFQVCPVFGSTTEITSNFGLSKPEESFFENPDNFPCKGDKEELLVGTVTLYFNKQKWPDASTAPEHLVVFKDTLYSLQGSGSNTPYDLANQIDDNKVWEQGLIATFPGAKAFKLVGFYDTNPATPEEKRTLADASLTVFHGKDGKFTTLLMVFNGQVYKSVAIVKQVDSKVLVDYTSTP